MCHHCQDDPVRYGYCRTHWMELTPQSRAFVALYAPATPPPVLFLSLTRT